VAVQRVPDLRQQVFDQLREEINSGTLADDEKLTEMTVAARYSVSRTPAREALALLVHAGLLVPEGRGYHVPAFSKSDIDNVFEVRRLIEPYAVGRIARDAADADLKAMLKFVTAEVKKTVDDLGYVKANQRLRARIFSLLENDKLQATIASFDDRLVFIRRQTLRDPAIRRISAEGNLRMAEAIAARDADAADKLMRHLLDEAQKAIVALI
jgi:DNA-binding GntR family transcriptional regulator